MNKKQLRRFLKEVERGDFYEAEFALSNGIEFTIIHNIRQQHGYINSLDAALDNWLARTDEYTAESFCKYINSKGVHKAMTRAQYDEILKSL